MSTERPNIMLIMSDQHKADSLQCYGNRHTRTPAINELAANGVVIDQMICNYPACTPGRSAVMTGRYPHTTGVRANHLYLPAHELSLPMLLHLGGYRLGLIGKNHVLPDGSLGSQFRVGAMALDNYLEAVERWPPELQPGAGQMADHRSIFDTWSTAGHFGPEGDEFADLREFASRPEYWRSYAGVGTLPFPAEHSTSLHLGAQAADFVHSGAGRDDPWFLWLSFPDPHNPYLAPEPYASMYDPQVVDIPPDDPMLDKPERHAISKRMNGMHGAVEQVVRNAVAMQYGQVSAIDDGIRRVLDALDETGQRDNTIVVFTTDHGGYVGDHGSWHKSLAFFDCLTRIPMIVSWPGTFGAGRADDGFMEQVDVLPTLLDLAGLEHPRGIQGRSMANVLDGSGALRDVAFSEGGEAGDPVTWDDLPFMPDSPLDSRYLGWDGFQEAWVGQGKMIRSERWKYVWWANGDEELYDMISDPDELVNLAGRPDPDTTALKVDFKDQLLTWSVTTEDQLAPHTFNIYLDDVAHDRLPF